MSNNQILDTCGKAEKEDLDRIELKFHIKIPADIREHYLAYNGGCPERAVFADENGEQYFVDCFIPVRNGEERSIEKTLGLLREDDGDDLEDDEA